MDFPLILNPPPPKKEVLEVRSPLCCFHTVLIRCYVPLKNAPYVLHSLSKFVWVLLPLPYETDIINITQTAVTRSGSDMICFVNAGCVVNSEKMLSRHLLCVFTDLTGLAGEKTSGYKGAHRLGYSVKVHTLVLCAHLREANKSPNKDVCCKLQRNGTSCRQSGSALSMEASQL